MWALHKFSDINVQKRTMNCCYYRFEMRLSEFGSLFVVLDRMNAANRHKDAFTGQKKVALLSDVLWPVSVLFLWGPCSTEHAEHA